MVREVHVVAGRGDSSTPVPFVVPADCDRDGGFANAALLARIKREANSTMVASSSFASCFEHPGIHQGGRRKSAQQSQPAREPTGRVPQFRVSRGDRFEHGVGHDARLVIETGMPRVRSS
jgi:hypothetical protein